ncbi:HK97 family phage prohead protease [Candidatus Frankia alpina]|uniref:Prohead serine protease domain-containing protein n=1 Tax=Candidatus Frankia alpina TaxID=2699483 RepID=A0A4S5ETD6_9ACTN|nr:HK97 family phage prohead protease [Candidatus Frankia alpina]THJ75815.1 hypothetical protein E7Y31_03300 [Candidatus Frankia alpina]
MPAAIRGLHLIRGGAGPAAAPRLAARAAADEGTDGAAAAETAMPTMTVEFSRFDSWYEIDSWFEGRYLERTVPGAFRKTIGERGDQVKIMFNHGRDFQIGQKLLGVAEVLEERETSPYAEVPLFDTSYNRDLVPGLEAGAYGSSFMFEVLGEHWVYEPEASDYNPEGLPERSVLEVRLYEFGPVTWPANPDATSGLRSGVDWVMGELAETERTRHEQLSRSFAAFRALHGLRTSAPAEAATPTTTPDPQMPAPARAGRHVDGKSLAAARGRRLTLMTR